jgi:hypothetical protein
MEEKTILLMPCSSKSSLMKWLEELKNFTENMMNHILRMYCVRGALKKLLTYSE